MNPLSEIRVLYCHFRIKFVCYSMVDYRCFANTLSLRCLPLPIHITQLNLSRFHGKIFEFDWTTGKSRVGLPSSLVDLKVVVVGEKGVKGIILFSQVPLNFQSFSHRLKLSSQSVDMPMICIYEYLLSFILEPPRFLQRSFLR